MSINKVPSHLLNGELMPLPHTVPVRNEDGNMYTGDALGFKGKDFEIPLIMQETGHLKSGLFDVWDSVNLPIEEGTFTAKVTGFGEERDGFTMIVNECYYRRVGKIVHVDIRVQFGFSAKTGAPSTDQVRITGLPFAFPKYICANIGFASGVNLNNSSRQLFSYVHPDGGLALLSEDFSSGTSTYHVLTSANFIKSGVVSPSIDLALSFTARI